MDINDLNIIYDVNILSESNIYAPKIYITDISTSEKTEITNELQPAIITLNSTIQAIVENKDEVATMKYIDGTIKPKEYEGNYNIIPNDSDQILNTLGKLLQENVVVSKIPYLEVPNELGITVTIGG